MDNMDPPPERRHERNIRLCRTMNTWTPRRVPVADMSGRNRRTDRKRLRANLRIVTKFDPARLPPEDNGYTSSDMEQDYRELAAAKEKAEIVEELRARRTRVIRKSDAIKLKVGKNLVAVVKESLCSV